MKRLNLDETWRLCLSMWRWIAKEKRAGNKETVHKLKAIWLINHGFEKENIDSDCFFCEYHGHRKICDYEDCKFCPAAKIERGFSCKDMNCNYQLKPIAFFNNLVSLNRKRLKNRRKK